jgi:hypothetical protein
VNTRLRWLIAIILIVAPFVARSAWFYRGGYAPPNLPDIEQAQFTLPAPTYQPSADEPIAGHGRVVFDVSHANNLSVDDLTPLQDRLAARGAAIRILDEPDRESDITLMEVITTELRSATAWVIAAPVRLYTAEERDALIAFVDDGGRLLLVADPTRPRPPEEESGFLDLSAILFPVSATPAINSVANAFGAVFFDDYLYNLNDNDGNYRNVRLNHFGDAALTDGLDSVVFFATHSVRSDGVALVGGSDGTLSSTRTGETDLSAAALAGNGRVLALGDLSVLSAPYHTVADNDRFLSNIADWLAVDAREWNLEDFPYLFDGAVDLVQLSDGTLDARLIARSDDLRQVFARAGLELSLRIDEQIDHNTLFVGTFANRDAVKEYLAAAGVSIRLGGEDSTDGGSVETPEVESDTEVTATPESESDTPVEATPTPTPEAEATPSATDQSEETVAPEETPDATEADKSGEAQEAPEDSITIEGAGAIGIQGATLFVIDRQPDRVVVIALAEDGEAAIAGLERLAAGDLSGCVSSDTITLCATDEAQDGFGLDESAPEPEAEATPTVEPEAPVGEGEGDASGSGDQGEVDQPPTEVNAGARILIISSDAGPQGERTSAAEFEAILGEVYDVTVWSISEDGSPDLDLAADYDGVIIDSGDYASDPTNMDALLVLSSVRGRVLLIGAQPLPLFDPNVKTGLLEDIEVADASHALAQGLDAGQVIALGPSESGVPAYIFPQEGDAGPIGDEVTIVFVRGPDSAEPGSIVAVVTPATDLTPGLILATFEFYRLPPDVQRIFAFNAAKWLTDEE